MKTIEKTTTIRYTLFGRKIENGYWNSILIEFTKKEFQKQKNKTLKRFPYLAKYGLKILKSVVKKQTIYQSWEINPE